MKKRISIILSILLIVIGAKFIRGYLEKKNSLQTPKERMNETDLFSLAQQRENISGCHEALPIYQQLLKKDPNHMAGKELLVNCYIRLKQYQEALSLYKSINTETMTIKEKKKYKNKIQLIEHKISNRRNNKLSN